MRGLLRAARHDLKTGNANENNNQKIIVLIVYVWRLQLIIVIHKLNSLSEIEPALL